MPDLSGQAVKGYEIGDVVGSGTFAVVYRAFQPVVEREVAIKIIHSHYVNEPQFIRRFEVEAQVVARLEHPHIVPLYDYWRSPEGAYLVMRYLRGGSLRESLYSGPLSLQATSDYLQQIAAALSVAHRNGVVHQDIKPDNILLDEGENAYLSDFGIARVLLDNTGSPASKKLFGSPAYMSPEAIISEPTSPQSDIYSLGIMVYELLTGLLPFDAEENTVLFDKHIRQPMPSIQAAGLDLPIALDQVIWKATAKHPAARYADVMSMAGDFARIVALNQDSQAGPISQQTQTSSDLPAHPAETLPLTAAIAVQNPFKGLRPFGEADAADFFGRDTLVQDLLNWFTNGSGSGRFLAVIGPSGSGKSSVVRAGLIPALRGGAVPGSDRWFITTMVPGARPLEALRAALLQVAVAAPETTRPQADFTVMELVRQSLPDVDSHLLLVIDQFEEVFTVVDDEADRSEFLELLQKTLQQFEGRFHVVVTLRADYYDRPLQYAGFGELMRGNTEVVLPLSHPELVQVVSEPARRMGIVPRENLVATVVADVSEQPGALPLLQYTLTELFEHRQGGVLSLESYLESGGISGALARRANELYEQLPSDELRSAAQKIFLALVALGDDSEATRRRIPQSDLFSGEEDKEAVLAVLETYSKFRLLTFDRDPVTRAPTVEIAHEALITEWDLLREWVDSSRDDLRTHRRLSAAAEEWVKSNREPSFLAGGERLSQFKALAERHVLGLTDIEAAYMHASIALQRRRTRRIQIFVAVLILATILAAAAAVFAFDRQSRALAERNRADRQAQIARSRELAATTLTNLEAEPDLALLLSVEALSMADTFEARSSLLTALQFQPQLETFLQGHTDAVRSVDFSPDGRLVASGGRDDTIIIWDTTVLPAEGRPLTGHTDWVNSVAFSPDGRLLASGGADGTVRIWDVESGEMLEPILAGHTDAVWSVAFSPDGDRLASSGADGSIIIWDVATHEMVGQPLTGHTDIVYAVQFSPDGDVLASGAGDNTVRLWDAASGDPLGDPMTGHTGWVLTLDFSPDGQLLATSGVDATVILWGVSNQQQLIQYPTSSQDWIRSVAFLPNGLALITASADGTVRLLDISTGAEIGNGWTAHEDAVWSVAPHPDGDSFVSAGADGKLILWNLAQNSHLEDRRIDEGQSVTDLAVDPQGAFVASALGDLSGTSTDTSVVLQATESDAEPVAWTGHGGVVTSVAFSPDGTMLAAASADYNISLWDVERSQPLDREVVGHTDVIWDVKFSPDGRWLASGGDDNTIILQDLSASDAESVSLTGHTGGILALAFSRDGKLLASGGRDNTIRLWDVEKQEMVGEPLEGHTDSITSLVFSPDGTVIISGSRDRMIIFWDVASGEPLSEPLQRHANWVLSLAVSSDGRILASGGRDNAIYLWDTDSLQSLGGPLLGHTDWVNGLSFSPDDRWLISGGNDGAVIFWDTSLNSWKEKICQTAGRHLTPGEWARFFQEISYSQSCS